MFNKSVFLRVVLSALLLLFITVNTDVTETACKLSDNISKNYKKWQLKMTASGDDGVLLTTLQKVTQGKDVLKGTRVTIKCANPGEVFVNEVRGIKDVNLTAIDEANTEGSIVITCSSIKATKWAPEVFGLVKSNVRNSGYRHVYCQPGCSRWVEYSHSVTYPPGTLSQERNSPPVLYTVQPIQLSCREGFVRAEQDILPDKVYCNQTTKAWSNTNSNVMKCVRGCKDVRKLTDGSSPMKTRGKEGEAPFKTGDILAFSCNSGKELKGYSTVTCDATNLWSDDLPKCG